MKLSVIVVFALVLTGWNNFIPSVSGFVPTTYLTWILNGITFRFNRGTVTHRDMTRQSILQVLRAIFLDNPNMDSSARILSLQSIDESSLITAYYGRNEGSITSSFKLAIKTINDANSNVDLDDVEEKLAEAHFDSEQFQSGQNRLIMLRANAESQ